MVMFINEERLSFEHFEEMGLSNKVAFILVIVVYTQISYRLCLPSKLKQAALNRLKSSNPSYNYPPSTPYTSPQVNKLQQQTKFAIPQNVRSNQFQTKETMFKTYNFPETDYPLENSPRDPFYGMSKNYNRDRQFSSRQMINSYSDNAATINNLKKDMKMKRRLSSYQQLYTNNFQAGQKVSSPVKKYASSSDPVHVFNSETFPEVQYPLNAMETWVPTYWNQNGLNNEEQRFGSSLNPKISNNSQSSNTKLTKTKAKQFLKPYDELREEKKRVLTTSTKRSGKKEKGAIFNKTQTCEKNAEDLMSIGMLAFNDTEETKSKASDTITSLKEKQDFENQSVPITYENSNEMCFVYKNDTQMFYSSTKENTDCLKKISSNDINVSLQNNEQLYTVRISHETPENLAKDINNNSTEDALVLGPEKSDSYVIDSITKVNTSNVEFVTEVEESFATKDSDISKQKAINATDFTSEENTSVGSDNSDLRFMDMLANSMLEELPTLFSSKSVSEVPPAEERVTVTNESERFNVQVPVQNNDSNSSTLTSQVSTSIDVTTLSNLNNVPGSSIIIIPLNNGVNQPQSQVIQSAGSPIILYIPSSTHSYRQVDSSNQQMSPDFDNIPRIKQPSLLRQMDSSVNNNPLQTVDLFTKENSNIELINVMHETSPENSMNHGSPLTQSYNPYNIQSESNSSINHSYIKTVENCSLNNGYDICAHVDNITFLNNEPFENIITNEFPITAREMNIEHLITDPSKQNSEPNLEDKSFQLTTISSNSYVQEHIASNISSFSPGTGNLPFSLALDHQSFNTLQGLNNNTQAVASVTSQPPEILNLEIPITSQSEMYNNAEILTLRENSAGLPGETVIPLVTVTDTTKSQGDSLIVPIVPNDSHLDVLTESMAHNDSDGLTVYKNRTGSLTPKIPSYNQTDILSNQIIQTNMSLPADPIVPDNFPVEYNVLTDKMTQSNKTSNICCEPSPVTERSYSSINKVSSNTTLPENIAQEIPVMTTITSEFPEKILYESSNASEFQLNVPFPDSTAMIDKFQMQNISPEAVSDSVLDKPKNIPIDDSSIDTFYNPVNQVNDIPITEYNIPITSAPEFALTEDLSPNTPLQIHEGFPLHTNEVEDTLTLEKLQGELPTQKREPFPKDLNFQVDVITTEEKSDAWNTNDLINTQQSNNHGQDFEIFGGNEITSQRYEINLEPTTNDSKAMPENVVDSTDDKLSKDLSELVISTKKHEREDVGKNTKSTEMLFYVDKQNHVVEKNNDTLLPKDLAEKIPSRKQDKEELTSSEVKILKALLQNILPYIEKIIIRSDIKNTSLLHYEPIATLDSELRFKEDINNEVVLSTFQNETNIKLLTQEESIPINDSKVNNAKVHNISAVDITSNENTANFALSHVPASVYDVNNVPLNNEKQKEMSVEELDDEKAKKLSIDKASNEYTPASEFEYDVNEVPLETEQQKKKSAFEMKILKSLLPKISEIVKGSLISKSNRTNEENSTSQADAIEAPLFNGNENKFLAAESTDIFGKAETDAPADEGKFSIEKNDDSTVTSIPTNQAADSNNENLIDYIPVIDKKKTLSARELRIVKVILENLLPKIKNGGLKFANREINRSTLLDKPFDNVKEELHSEDSIDANEVELENNLSPVEKTSPEETQLLLSDNMNTYFYDLHDDKGQEENLANATPSAEQEEENQADVKSSEEEVEEHVITELEDIIDYLPFATEMKEDVRVIKDLLEYLLFDISNGALALDKGRIREKRH